ncbi:MAG: methyl-accepting chemotaxis protein [Pseudomonadota bacterium]
MKRFKALTTLRRRRRRSRLSLATKLGAWLIFTLGATLGAALWVGVVTQEQAALDMTAHHHTTTTEFLADAMRGGVRWQKPDRIRAAYQPLRSDVGSELTALVVLDSAGRTLERYSDARAGNSTKTLLDNMRIDSVADLFVVDDFLFVVRPIYAKAPRDGAAPVELGRLGTVWSLASVRDAIGLTVRSEVVVAATTLVVAAALLMLLMLRMVTHPLRRAVEFAEAVARGSLDNRLHSPSGDEIGQLGRALNFMQSELGKRESSNRAFNAEIVRLKHALEHIDANVLVTDAQSNIIYLNNAAVELFTATSPDIAAELGHFDTSALLGSRLDAFGVAVAQRLDAALGTGKAIELNLGNRIFQVHCAPLHDDDDHWLGGVTQWVDRTDELEIEREVALIVSAAERGDLSNRISVKQKTREQKAGFFELLSRSVNDLLRVSENLVDDVSRVLGAVARGSLEETITTDYEGSFGQLKDDVNSTVAKLRAVIGGIKHDAVIVARGTDEMSEGQSALSQRSTMQVQTLLATAKNVSQMTTSVQTTASNAAAARSLAEETKVRAVSGGDVVHRAVESMHQINGSSNEVVKIIAVIDEIAFQTSLLALNAAVEAARAGEQGRGFAVVANEVRSLATRSADAAKQIKALIEDSVDRVQRGTALVNESGDALENIVESVDQLVEIVTHIAKACHEQSVEIEDVNRAVHEMDESTQQNKALVDEAAAITLQMNAQAHDLNDRVAFFVARENPVSNG